MDETTAFIDSKIDENAMTILAGDFNIMQNPMNKHYSAKIFTQSPGHVEHFNLIDNEYGNLLKTLANGGKSAVCNIWQRDNKG